MNVGKPAHLSTSDAQEDVEVMRGYAPGPVGAENAELGDRLEGALNVFIPF